ncbi:EAL domain-containing protein [Salmonella enterica]|nr:EAL domain-containing protein [Salmonella enterica]
MNLKRNDIYRAFENGGVIPFFQPIIDLHSKRCVGVEVLSRLVLDGRQVFLPNDFIDTVLKDNKELMLFEIILNKSFSIFNEIGIRDDFFITINVTANILGSGFLSNLINDLKGGIKCDFFLEVTEHFPLTDLDKGIIDNVRLIKSSGVKLALDDYGTGFSNLSMLNYLDFDMIKIPKEFLSYNFFKSDMILDNIKHLSDIMNLSVIVEGVESAQECFRLKHKGFKYVQGYLFSPPLPFEDFVSFYYSTSDHYK